MECTANNDRIVWVINIKSSFFARRGVQRQDNQRSNRPSQQYQFNTSWRGGRRLIVVTLCVSAAMEYFYYYHQSALNHIIGYKLLFHVIQDHITLSTHTGNYMINCHVIILFPKGFRFSWLYVYGSLLVLGAVMMASMCKKMGSHHDKKPLKNKGVLMVVEYFQGIVMLSLPPPTNVTRCKTKLLMKEFFCVWTAQSDC